MPGQAISTSRTRVFDYRVVESTEVGELPRVAATCLGRRTARTFALLPPSQKN
jgi:hypothetical protein